MQQNDFVKGRHFLVPTATDSGLTTRTRVACWREGGIASFGWILLTRPCVKRSPQRSTKCVTPQVFNGPFFVALVVDHLLGAVSDPNDPISHRGGEDMGRRLAMCGRKQMSRCCGIAKSDRHLQ